MALRERVLRARRLYVARRKRQADNTAKAKRHYLDLLGRYRERKANKFRASMLNGHPGNVTREVKAAIVRATKAGLIVTSTTDLTHSPTSLHYRKPKGQAVDVAGPYDKMIAFQRSELARGAEHYLELFGPDSFYVKNGVKRSGAFPAHGDHVHVAPR